MEMNSFEELLIYNAAEMSERWEDEEEFLVEILNLYLEDLPEYIDNLEKALESGDYKEALIIAHTVKGASSNVCADRLRAIAEKMDDLAEEGKYEEVKSLFPAFKDTAGKIRDEFIKAGVNLDS